MNQGWLCLKIVFIWSDELNFNFNFTLCSKHVFHINSILDIDPTTSNIKTCTTKNKIKQL